MYLSLIRTKLNALVFIIIILVSSVIACSGSSQSENHHIIRGQVISVIAKSISEVQSFEVKTPSGQIYQFHASGFIGFTPSHIKEHQVTGQPVTVTYTASNDLLMAVEITD